MDEKKYFKILMILLLVTSIFGYGMNTIRRRIEYSPYFSIKRIELANVVEGVHIYLIDDSVDIVNTDPRDLIEVTRGIVYPNETLLLTIYREGYMLREEGIEKTHTIVGTEVIDLISLRFSSTKEGERYIALLLSNLSANTLLTVTLILDNKIEYYEAFMVIEAHEVIEISGYLLGKHQERIPFARLEVYAVENASNINPLTLDRAKVLTFLQTNSRGEFTLRIINASLPPELKHIVVLYRDLGFWIFTERSVNKYNVVIRE
ncbi:MAG: hypothetical protein DRJ49_07300 [Thermoprotei archaeon]|nr:MAG: hypothetical protein DRJ49_07300 [Thermoprotei archaeon]